MSSSINNKITANYTTKRMGNGTEWTVYQVYDNSSNSPISDIYLSLSKPCGNRNQDYMHRPVNIRAIYGDDTSSCTYNDNGKEHSMYVEAGYD